MERDFYIVKVVFDVGFGCFWLFYSSNIEVVLSSFILLSDYFLFINNLISYQQRIWQKSLSIQRSQFTIFFKFICLMFGSVVIIILVVFLLLLVLSSEFYEVSDNEFFLTNSVACLDIPFIDMAIL